MNEKCLLIKTKENKNFFTHENNLQSLVEYIKTFNAELLLVKPSPETKILELKELTVALCDPNYNYHGKFEIIEKIFPKNKRARQSILVEAKIIRGFIRNKFLSDKQISLKELKEKFQNYRLTDACLCNHLAMARKDLAKDGFKFTKTGAGKYSIVD